MHLMEKYRYTLQVDPIRLLNTPVVWIGLETIIILRH